MLLPFMTYLNLGFIYEHVFVYLLVLVICNFANMLQVVKITKYIVVCS